MCYGKIVSVVFFKHSRMKVYWWRASRTNNKARGGGIPRTSRVDVKELQHSVETPNLVFGCDV